MSTLGSPLEIIRRNGSNVCPICRATAQRLTVVDFKVNNSQLNLSFDPPSSYAGNIQTARPGHADDTLFFWAFETTTGSLINTTSGDPWLIWLNGGHVYRGLRPVIALTSRCVQSRKFKHARPAPRGPFFASAGVFLSDPATERPDSIRRLFG